MFGISAFAQSPFAALGGSPIRVEISGVASTSALGTTTQTGIGNVTPTGQVGTSAVAGVGVNAQAVATLPSLVSTVGSVAVTTDAEANVTPVSYTHLTLPTTPYV